MSGIKGIILEQNQLMLEINVFHHSGAALSTLSQGFMCARAIFYIFICSPVNLTCGHAWFFLEVSSTRGSFCFIKNMYFNERGWYFPKKANQARSRGLREKIKSRLIIVHKYFQFYWVIHLRKLLLFSNITFQTLTTKFPVPQNPKIQ